jgi:homoserine dehydrogenase
MATVSRQMEQSRLAAGSICKIALVGFGTVGSCVARLLSAHVEHPLRLTHICNRQVARKKVDWIPRDVTWTEDIEEVLASDADVVVELLGGFEPAHDWVRRALQSHKSVVTANKQLMAHCGSELLDLARNHGQYLGFGACVAGGVPLLAGLHDGLAGDRLVKICGILNGTCNYILTRMEQGGSSFAEGLREAQQAGLAEADPSEDIDGLDAGAKLVIVARFGLNVDIRPEQVLCRSIRNVKPVDFEYAHDLGCTIRQISTVRLGEEGIYAVVEPAIVSRNSPLAGVSGAENLIVSTGAFGGDTVFAGRGAGGDPTAVAVVSDLLQAAKCRSYGLAWPDHRPARLCEVTHDLELPRYVRFVVRDRVGIIAAVASIFARHQINLDAVLQKPGYAKSELPFVITLEPCKQSQLEAALSQLEGADFLAETPFTMSILQ